MNREIKFKVYDKQTNKVYEIQSIYFDTNGQIRSVRPIIFDGESFDFPERDILNVKMLEYTGLKDKNGIEIYEGDIIEIKMADKSILIATIVWMAHNARWGYDADGATWGVGTNKNNVIGNIYENPELLKTEKKDE